MGEALEIKVGFQGLNAAQADAAAESLTMAINALGVAESTARLRERDDTQDFGATLVIVLASPAIIALAKGLADWIRRRDAGEIVITAADGSSVKVTGGPASNVDVKKLAQIMKAPAKKK